MQVADLSTGAAGKRFVFVHLRFCSNTGLVLYGVQIMLRCIQICVYISLVMFAVGR